MRVYACGAIVVRPFGRCMATLRELRKSEGESFDGYVCDACGAEYRSPFYGATRNPPDDRWLMTGPDEPRLTREDGRTDG